MRAEPDQRSPTRIDGRAPNLPSLTGLRAPAAVAVVLLHSVRSPVNANAFADLGPLGRIASAGYLGVNVFFVLSGFVLAWTYRPDDTPRAFYRRRFARVYPLHIATWAIAAAIIFVSKGGLPWFETIVSALLLKAWIPDPYVYFAINGVSWSLSDEAFFYCLCPLVLALIAGRRTRAAAIGMTGMILALALTAYQAADDSVFPQGQDLWVSPIFGLGGFLVGIATAIAVR